MSKLDGLSTSEPINTGSLYGAYNATVRGASMEKKTKRKDDTPCNPFYEVTAEVVYEDSNGKERTRKIFGRLPMDWKKEDTQFGSLYLAKGTEWTKLVENFEKETEGEVVALLGAKRHWQTNEVNTYEDDEGNMRISYEVIEFHKAGSDHKEVWTQAHDAVEKAAIQEVLGKSTSDAAQSTTNDPQAPATVEDLNF